ncbi:hypothetical protein Rhe02_84060 [Rhizocola hellebori]|uniref:Attractin/MKLN-like beta-propeller domain-containing protein n=1 Tax=Rhizocola hellebori TaxID=1392758 RepID=A0A8J3QIG3_9ACTN|nr:kelch repeat-containing protein [Rhizocola hellebori]GIH10339.1 hypothetical protein Rhe02_84060 [Rhizocola hellebori]
MKALIIVKAVILAAVVTAIAAPSHALASGTILTWSARTAMPTARYSTAHATTSDGDVIVFGGLLLPGASTTGIVERFHPATNSWTTLAPMPHPRHNAVAVTATDGTILVVGGFPAGGDSTNIVDAYNPATNTWTTRASLPVNAAGPSAARGPDGTIYVIGGYPGCCFTYLNTVFAYDQANDSWIQRASMPTRRQSSSATLAPDGKIYVIGGNGTGPIDRTVEAYDPATNTWQVKALMPIGGGGLAWITAPNGKLYAFGYDDLGTVLEYDTTADTWTPVEPMPTPRQGPASALAGDGSIYAIGGYLPTAAQTTAVNERASFTGAPVTPMYNVAVNTKAANPNNSISATATVEVPSGDTVTVSVATGTFAGAVGCGDSKGNTYTLVADKNTGNGRLFVCSATLTTPLTIGDSVFATYPGFSGLSVISVNAIPAAVTDGAVDQTSTNAGNNPNPHSGNVTILHPTELLFGVVAHNSTPTFTAGAGFTVIGAITGGTGSGTKTITPQYMPVTATGTYAATGTLSSSQQWRAAIITYQ